MDVISPPEVIEEVVTDLDIAFLNGIRSLTLKSTDTVKCEEHYMVVEMGEPKETIWLCRAHILWHSERQRTIRRPVKKEKAIG